MLVREWADLGERLEWLAAPAGLGISNSMTLVLNGTPVGIFAPGAARNPIPAGSRQLSSAWIRSATRRPETMTVGTPVPGCVLAPTKYKFR